jgi:hypothetical protein
MTRPQRALSVKIWKLKTNMAEIQSAKNWKAVFKQLTGTIQLIVLYVRTEYIEVISRVELNYVNVCGTRLPRDDGIDWSSCRSWQSAMSKFQ